MFSPNLDLDLMIEILDNASSLEWLAQQDKLGNVHHRLRMPIHT
jgi:hypothetical protein